MSYKIVEFEDGLHIIPFSWLTDDDKKAYWPPYKDVIKICKSVANMVTPVKNDWELLTVLDVHGSAGTYPEAAEKMKLMSDVSDMEPFASDEAQKKSRARRHKVLSTRTLRLEDEEEEEDETPEEVTKQKVLPKKPATFMTVTEIRKNDKRKNDNPQTSPVPSTDTETQADAEVRVAGSQAERQDSASTKLPSANNPKDVELKEFHVEMLRILTQIGDKLEDMNSRLKVIEEKGLANQVREVGDNGDNPDRESIEDLLPLATLLQFDEFEKKLEEKEFASQMVSFLKSIGGRDTHNFLSNVLKRSVTNSVAVEFSMDGKKKKKPMRNTLFLKMIIRAAALHRPNLEEATAIKDVSTWLAGAKLRQSREK